MLVSDKRGRAVKEKKVETGLGKALGGAVGAQGGYFTVAYQTAYCVYALSNDTPCAANESMLGVWRDDT